MVSRDGALSAEHRTAVAELLRERASPSALGTVPVVVRGDCMAPRLVDGQTVAVRLQGWALPGDVVAFERGAADAGLAVHRLLGIRPSRRGLVWVTQADNEPLADPAFALDRLVGVADIRISPRDRLRAVGRLIPAVLTVLGPVRERLDQRSRAARRTAVPVSRSASR